MKELSAVEIVKAVQQAQRQGRIDFDEKGNLMILGSARLQIGGVFDSWVLRHEDVERAIEDGDPEKEAWVRNMLFAKGGVNSDHGYFRMMEDSSHNLIPDAGVNAALNILLRTATSKISNWYQGPIKTNVTPASGWLSNWSGSGGAAPGSELVPTTDYTAASRVEAVFGTASAKSIVTSTASRFTLASGASNITLYGSTLNSVATAAYNVTDQVLLAATLFSAAKSGLGAADKIDIEYTLTGASA